MNALAITIGAGRGRPQGRSVPVDDIGGTLIKLPTTQEAWWSPHSWKGAYRLEKGWLSSCAAVIDVDFKFKDTSKRCKADPSLVREPTLDEVEALAAAARMMPGTHWHPTPGGARVIAMFAEPCVDRELAIKAIAGLCKLASELLDELPYEVDLTTSLDLARLFYTPNAFAKGVQRKADVTELRAVPYTPEELAAHAPPPEEPKAKSAARPMPTSIGAAIEKWNADHRIDIPRNTAPCPVCKDSASFGQLPGDDQRWYCFSSDHPDNIGVRGQKGYHGDALDLDCHWRGLPKVDILRDDGYLPKSKPKAPSPPREEATVTSIDERRRPLRNNSYLTAYTIVRMESWPNSADKNKPRGILDQRRIEFNEMSGRPELGRRPIKDSDITTVRAEIERFYFGGQDGDGNEVGLKLSKSDVDDAVRQVADEHPYHPVRDYLAGLKWDGTERLDHVAADILNAEDTTLNRVMVRKFFISAIARAMDPGCKVDTVLILVGKQGKLKSTFFDALAGPWFIDSNIDIRNKDAFQTIRNAWVFEWGELEKYLRLDLSVVKAFVTSRIDNYRRSFGHYSEDVPRSVVIVGSTNDFEFLIDDENRRFWPIVVGARIEFNTLREQRDQLWAEALHVYAQWVKRGKRREDFPWWLTDDEESQLVEVHYQHRVLDSWESLILGFADRQTAPFTTSAILGGPLNKEPGQWNKGDEMRISRVLRAAGYDRRSEGETRAKKWFRVNHESTLSQPRNGSTTGNLFTESTESTRNKKSR